jgi:hypothetical protein
MQKLILIVQASVINSNIFMHTLRVIMMGHLEAMLELEALPLFYIKHIFVL